MKSVAGIFLTSLLAFSVALVTSGRTTQNLKEIFIGRCHEFYNIIQPKATPKNCTLLWQKFHSAFAYKSACNVKPNDYNDFMTYADEGKKLKKTLFWEATKETVEIFTQINPSFVALGNTFQGYIANRLLWCGGNSVDGINYTMCPTERQCGFEVYYPYWAYASKQFAQKVQGTVYVLLNGSRTDGTPTYSRSSYFATLELPFMNNKSVDELRVWVIYDLYKGQKEKCGQQSLRHLAEDARKYGLKMTCMDNPRELRPLLCSMYPEAKDCKCYRDVSSSAPRYHQRPELVLENSTTCVSHALTQRMAHKDGHHWHVRYCSVPSLL